jgi:CubicO group peptidase (beta-lactamase class C family)
MSSGLAWDESGSYLRPGNSETRMRFSLDPDRYVFDREFAAEPGTVFNYNGGGVALLGEVIARAAHQPLEAFADEVLFKPLDIHRTEWRRDRQHRVTPFGGLRLRPRDMAKIGRLVLDRGRWNGRQLVPASWIDQMTQARLPAGRLRYVWLWWLGTIDSGTTRHPYIAAFGNGGQRIYLVPDLDLVVVVTAGQYNQDTSWQAPLRVLQRVVGFVK